MSKPLQIPQLSLLGDDFDFHIRKINKLLPGSITEIGEYLESLKIQESSFNTYCAKAKKALKKRYGIDYHYKAGLRPRVDEYFRLIIKVVPDSEKNRRIPWDDIATLMIKGGRRTAALLEAYCRTGLRASELCNATWANLRRDEKGFRLFVIGKRKKKRWIPMPADLIGNLKKVFNGNVFLIETETHKNYTRKEVYHLFYQGSRRNLGYSFGIHVLRHTFASNVYENWPNLLKALSKQLGHSSVEMTMKYIHQDLEVQHLPQMPQASLFDFERRPRPARRPPHKKAG